MGKLCVKREGKGSKILTRKKNVLVHNPFFGNLKSAIFVQSKGPLNLRSCFNKGKSEHAQNIRKVKVHDCTSQTRQKFAD